VLTLTSHYPGDDMEITGPMQPEQYVTIADFKAAGRGQISFSKDEIVDVLDKNPNGRLSFYTESQKNPCSLCFVQHVKYQSLFDKKKPLGNSFTYNK